MAPLIGLRTKTLFLALLPLLLMLLIVGMIWFFACERMARDVVLQRDAELARVTAARLCEQLDHYTRDLQDIVSVKDVQSMAPKNLQATLFKIQHYAHIFDEGLVFYDQAGQKIVHPETDNIHLFEDFPLKAEWFQLKKTFRPVFSNIFSDDISGKDLLLIAIPIVGGGGEFKGALAGIATVKYSMLQTIFGRLLEIKPGKSGFSYLVDGNGRVIYHRHSSQIGRQLSTIEPVQRVMLGETGALRTSDEIGKNIVSGFAPVPKTPWGIVTQEWWDVIMAPMHKYSLILIALLSVGFLLSGAVLFVGIGLTLVKPILRLAKTSQQIATTSDYAVRVEKRSNDEIGYLYDDFNSMLEQIRIREKELFQAKSLLNNVINSMPSMLISTSNEGIITQWNEAAAKHTGVLASDAIGKQLWDIAPIFRKYRPHYQEVIMQRSPKAFYRETFAGEDDRYFDITLFPLIANGTQGLVIRLDDVTELEEKEYELRQTQKMESIGTLAGGLAHDFNNVLVGITGTLSLLGFKISKTSEIKSTELKNFVNVMQEAADRAADMVKQLLTLARKQKISFTPVDLNPALKHVMKICGNSFDKCIELQPLYFNKPVMVNADPTQMEQVLLNLCINAGHAMTIMRGEGESQGGKLTVEIDMIKANRHFCSTHPEAAEGGYWRMSVRDTGVGMDKKTVAKIFDPFFTTKEKGKGSGLGMAVAYNILQAHHGFIDVYSEVGVGSTFNVYLPILHKEVSPAASQKQVTITKGEGLILVVDDEDMVRGLAKAILEECGYSVILTKDGEEGVAIFRQRHTEITAVLLDMVMPKKSGKEAYLEMKAMDKDVKVILSSGFKQDERVQAILDLGVKGFLQKPFSLEQMAKMMHRVIHGEEY